MFLCQILPAWNPCLPSSTKYFAALEEYARRHRRFGGV